MKASPSRLIPGLVLLRFAHWVLHAFLSGVLFYLLPLVPGLVLQAFFRRVESGEFHSAATALLAVLVGFACVRLAALVIANVVEVALTSELTAGLRVNVLEALICRSRDGSVSRGQVFTRLRDDARSLAVFVAWIPDPVGQAVAAGLAIGVLFSVSPRLTVLVVIPLLVVLLLANALSPVVRRLRERAQNATADAVGFARDTLGGAELVKAMRAEGRVSDQFAKRNRVRVLTSTREAALSALMDSLAGGAGTVGTALVLLLALGELKSGRLSVGDVVLFATYIQAVAEASRLGGNVIRFWRNAQVSARRLSEVTGEAPHVLARSPGFRSIRHRPPTEDTQRLPRMRSVRISLSTAAGSESAEIVVPRGSITIVIGSVGAGKSSLLRALSGVDDVARAGVMAIEWNDVHVTPETIARSRSLSYVPQQVRLFSGPLKENIQLGKGADPADLDEATYIAALEDDILGFEAGLHTQVGPSGVGMSGGQVQRTGLARAVIGSPDLLIADDVTSQLDPATTRRLISRLADAIERDRIGAAIVASDSPELRNVASQALVVDGHVVQVRSLGTFAGEQSVPGSPASRKEGAGDAG